MKNIKETDFNIDNFSSELGFKIKKEQLKNVFKLSNSEIELATQLPLVLAHNYYFSNEFNSIHIHADADKEYKSLSMDEYFIHPSYIPERELLKRESLVQNENETSAIKIRKSGQFQHFLPHDYISGNLFENADRIVITGSPGVGKSTYARWLCYKWAKTQVNINAVLIYLNLRNLNFNSKNAIANYIQDEYFKGTAVNENDLIKILSLLNENFLFILDGFDELDTTAQQTLKQHLYRLSPESKYILLSRPYGLLQTYGLNWDAAFQIDGFNHSNIHNYIDKFLTVNPKENKSKEALMQIIQDNSVLYDYAHNPLMLSFIVYIYLKSNNPDENLTKIQSQYDLQNEVFIWINKYEKNKKTYTENTKLLKHSEQFAYQLQIGKKHQYQSTEEPDKYADVLIYLSKTGIGNLRNQQTGMPKFNFNTITFREFFAARYLREFITDKAFLYLS
ncbi:MAG: NACHT domain-containing protein, partial [Bacteroidota bacterium]|nr:NACHT domain-containing protein [Bacteroidota bacterium]